MYALRFLVLSDTHNIQLDAVPLQKLPHADVLLHCGDLTEQGSLEELEKAIAVLEDIDVELKLVIAGNHDAVLDKDFYLGQGGDLAEHHRAIGLMHEAQDKGIHYLTEGIHTFTTNAGATFTVYATPQTPQHGACAFQYPSAEDRYNDSTDDKERPPWAKQADCLVPVPTQGIDIVMSHGPPKYILDGTTDGRSAGCEHLRRAICRAKPQLHAFGHIHSGYGIQRVQWQSDEGTEEDWS